MPYSALCSVAAVLLARIAACPRAGKAYELRDVDGRLIGEDQGRRICAEGYTAPAEVRTVQRGIPRPKALNGADGLVQRGVVERSEWSWSCSRHNLSRRGRKLPGGADNSLRWLVSSLHSSAVQVSGDSLGS